MRGLLILDPEHPQEVEISSFEVAYNKYKDYDFVLVVTTEGQGKVLDTKLEIIGVSKPSQRGVVQPDFEPLLLEDVDEEKLLLKKREVADIDVLPPTFDLTNLVKVGEEITLTTKRHVYSESNLLNKLVTELILKESEVVEGKRLRTVRQPTVIFSKDGKKCYIKESVEVYEDAKVQS